MKEILSARTERTKLFDIGGGRRRLVAKLRPVHYQEPGSAEWKDCVFEINPETLTLDKAPYIGEVHKNGIGYTVTERETGKKIRVTLENIGSQTGRRSSSIAAPAPEVQGNKVYFRDVDRDLDIRLDFHPDRVRLWKILKTDKASTDWEFRVEEDKGCELIRTVVTADGRDSAGRRLALSEAVSTLADTEEKTEVKIDRSWNKKVSFHDPVTRKTIESSEGVQYPVFVDTDVSYGVSAWQDDGVGQYSAWGSGSGSFWSSVANWWTSGYIQKTSSSANYSEYLRFTGITLPQSVTIDSADIKIRAWYKSGTGTDSIEAVQDTGGTSPSNPSTAKPICNGPYYTPSNQSSNGTTSVNSTTLGTSNPGAEVTLDVSTTVQSMVNSSAYSSGAMLFFLRKSTTNARQIAIYQREQGTTYDPTLEISYSSSSPQTINPSGIGSAESFGSASASPGAVTLSPSGISSGKSFGSPSISVGAVTLSPASIGSGEGFGSPDISAAAVQLEPTGISSAAAFGAPGVQPGAVTLSLSSITSNEIFGNPTLQPGAIAVNPSSISSSEALGNPAIEPGTFTITPGGIGSAESFGAPSISVGAVTLSPASITSAEAFGSPSISAAAVQLEPTGIGSGEAFGAPGITPGVITESAGSIVSAEAFGAPEINQNITAQGVESAEALGAPGIGLEVRPAGIASGEVTGAPDLQPGAVTITPAGIGSGEAFGAPGASAGGAELTPAGIGSAEAFGSPIAQPGAVTLSPGSINSAEAFGSPVISAAAAELSPSGISSGESFGSPSISVGAVTVEPAGIEGAQSFGSPEISSSITISPAGIDSAETFGAPGANFSLYPRGIDSAEGIADPVINPGAVEISPSGIGSAESFGEVSVASLLQVLNPSGIESLAAFGDPWLVDLSASAAVTLEAGSRGFSFEALIRSYTLEAISRDFIFNCRDLDFELEAENREFEF